MTPRRAFVPRLVPPEQSKSCAIACGTAATREPSRNLRSVSAVPASVNYRGPSQAFVALTRNPNLESPTRFEPTVKGENDVVI